jgi:phage terminase small subunit
MRKKPAQRGRQANRLTPRAERFVVHYLISLNATDAAKKAGYSVRTARQQGARLLSNVSIAAAIKAGQATAAERAQIKVDDVVEELRKVAFCNMADYSRLIEGGRVPDLSCATEEQMAVVSALDVTEDIIQRPDGNGDRVDGDDGFGGERTTVLRRRTKFRLHDKVNALIQLGRHLGGFGATLNVNQTVNVNIQHSRDEIRRLPPGAIDAIIDGVSELIGDQPNRGAPTTPTPK